jgi:hypothetical protein
MHTHPAPDRSPQGLLLVLGWLVCVLFASCQMARDAGPISDLDPVFLPKPGFIRLKFLFTQMTHVHIH